MHDDRVELHDVAASHTQVVRELAEEWERWAERAEVIPWHRIVAHYAGRGQTEEEAWM
jgi:hypothetical protein